MERRGRLCLAVAAVIAVGLLLPRAGTVPYVLAHSSSHAATAYERHLASLVSAPIPARNLYQLADQLVLRPPRRIARVVNRLSPNYRVGHQDNFWVLSEDQLKYFRMKASIRAESPHLYIYVQNGLKVSRSALLQAARTFETKTYPTDRNIFGSEWRPGVDGDVHITCLFADLKSSGIAGAFSAEDEYPTSVNPYSNQREMFYINTNTLPGTTDFDLTLAHEFQHMIHWHVHMHDSAWLNEGMSVLAQQLNGYSTSFYPQAFYPLPGTQLDDFAANSDNGEHYGAAYLFLAYIYARYGPGMIRALETDARYTDFELISDALRKRHIPLTANQLFGNWAVANVVKAKSGLYGYPELAQKVSVNSENLPASISEALKPYSSDYLSFDNLAGHKSIRLSFSAAPTVPLIGARSNQPFWWSNRGDMSDTGLQRSFDLRHVRHAHLHFGLWYRLEDGYDFGYVEASTDGGATWTTLRGKYTTTDKRTGANYGNGYTGSSKVWRQESIDLSPYAGKRIQIRFDMVTDDEVNLEGMTVRNVAIPEIGFRDTLEGWQSHGFVPVYDNSLPAYWHVKLIKFTPAGPKMSSLPLSALEAGSTSIATTGLQRVIVVVYFTAPKTTEKATFRVTATG